MKESLKEQICRYQGALHKLELRHDEELRGLAKEFAQSVALKPGTIIEDVIGRAEIIEMTTYYYGTMGAPLPVYRATNLTKGGEGKQAGVRSRRAPRNHQ